MAQFDTVNPRFSGNTQGRLELAVNDRQDAGGMLKATKPGAHSSNTGKKTHPPNIQSRTSIMRSRDDCALSRLTLRFAELLNLSKDGLVDLNLVSDQLHVAKRRLYDIVNVLEGINLIRKKTKNIFEYTLPTSITRENEDLKHLHEKERELDEMIQTCTRQVYQMCEDELNHRFAYLTCEDIKSIPDLKDQTVIVIKGPAETRLDVQNPKKNLQIHLKSTQGPIDVLLCSDDPEHLADTDFFMANSTQSPPPSPPISFAEVSSKKDGNNTAEVTFSNTLSRPAQHSSLVTVVPTSPTSLQPLSEDHQNFVPHASPLAVSLTVGSSPS